MKAKLFLLITLAFQACVSINSNQTGRSLGKGNNSVSGWANYGSAKDIEYYSLWDNDRYIFAEGRYMHGVNEDFDLGVTLNLATFFIVNTKYQVLGSKKSLFASSIGLDMGATPVTLMHAMTIGYMTSLKSFNSIHFTEKAGFTFTPTYIFLGRSQFSEAYGGPYRINHNLLGYSFGLFYGKKQTFFLEVSNLSTIQNFQPTPEPTISLGFTFNF
jgi:hypothetical protein